MIGARVLDDILGIRHPGRGCGMAVAASWKSVDRQALHRSGVVSWWWPGLSRTDRTAFGPGCSISSGTGEVARGYLPVCLFCVAFAATAIAWRPPCAFRRLA